MSATVQSHMQKYSCFYSDVILQFLSDLYTGDFITGKQTEEEAFDFHLVCKSLMKEGVLIYENGCLIPNPYKKEYESKYFGES